MSLLKFLKKSLCIWLCALMMSVPTYANTQQAMIATGVVLAEIDRAQAQQRVNEFISRADVQKVLIERGVSPDEAAQRLASLSEKEIRELAGQVDQARAGGDILVVIILVLLIIILIKKI